MEYIKRFESFDESIDEICKKYRLNAFLDEIGKSPVDSIEGYKNI